MNQRYENTKLVNDSDSGKRFIGPQEIIGLIPLKTSNDEENDHSKATINFNLLQFCFFTAADTFGMIP